MSITPAVAASQKAVNESYQRALVKLEAGVIRAGKKFCYLNASLATL